MASPSLTRRFKIVKVVRDNGSTYEIYENEKPLRTSLGVPVVFSNFLKAMKGLRNAINVCKSLSSF
jgi:hypothetical protein